MQQQEKRIVALSVAVTLLGGLVTMGEAEQPAMGPCNLLYVCGLFRVSCGSSPR